MYHTKSACTCPLVASSFSLSYGPLPPHFLHLPYLHSLPVSFLSLLMAFLAHHMSLLSPNPSLNAVSFLSTSCYLHPSWITLYDDVVQERLTKEIADAILTAINPTGVGVVVEATWVYSDSSNHGLINRTLPKFLVLFMPWCPLITPLINLHYLLFQIQSHEIGLHFLLCLD